MTERELVSVVVPVYNVERWLADALESIAAQTYGHLEVVMVDDGSTDGSAAICRRFCERDPRFRLLQCNFGAPGAARNEALRHIRGQWVTMVDSDDLLPEDALEYMLSVVHSRQEPADILQGRTIEFLDGDAPAYKKSEHIPAEISGEEAALSILYQDGRMLASPCAKLYRASLLKKFSFPETMLYEDLAAIPPLVYSCDKIVFSEHPVYLYRRKRHGSILSSFNPRRLDALKATDMLCQWAAGAPAVLQRASAERRLSAAFNMLGLLALAGKAGSSDADRCWQIIKEERLHSLPDSRARMRNRAASLLSLLGRRATTAATKIFYKR